MRWPGAPHALGLVTTIFLFRLVFAIALVPPWQNPDEPAHFERVRILARQTRLDLTEREDVTTEREILQSMAEHDWWASYDEPTPDPLPRDFSDAALREHVGKQTDLPPTYFLLGNAWVRALQVDDLLDQYYALRWLSALIAILTLWCVWAGARNLFGEAVALGATTLMALHPQFMLISIAVNPGALVNLCGAVIWWQASRLWAAQARLVPVGLILAAGVLAVLTKRIGAPLLVTGVVLAAAGAGPAASSWMRSGPFATPRRRAAWLAAVAGVAVVVGEWLLASWSGGPPLARWATDEVARLAHYWSELALFSVADRAGDWGFVVRFHEGLFDSAWLYAGWLRYPPPMPWRWVVRALVALAGCGLLWCLVRKSSQSFRTACAVAGAIVLIQLLGVYFGFLLNGYPAQGHYLFPVIGPFLALFWLGLAGWWPDQIRNIVGMVIIAVMATLDIFGWTTVLIPAYAR